MATYAIGDVQGCARTLQRLLDQLKPDLSVDRLWVAGDLVNRGPRSLEALRLVKSFGSAATVVLGNHDLHLIGVASSWRKPRPSDTFADVLKASDREELLDWLRTRPLVHRQGRFLMLHAGVLPFWSADQIESLAREAEQAIQGEEADRVFESLKEVPSEWHSEMKRKARIRSALFAFTRLRICTREGQPRDGFAGPPERAPKGSLPWFNLPGRKSAASTVVCGHWAAAGLRLRPDLIALDSGCVWRKTLSAVRLEDRRVFQQPFAD